ncbi:MAG: hypothetical protein U1E33_05090 [Rhodospirillales bacterium]
MLLGDASPQIAGFAAHLRFDPAEDNATEPFAADFRPKADQLTVRPAQPGVAHAKHPGRPIAVEDAEAVKGRVGAQQVAGEGVGAIAECAPGLQHHQHRRDRRGVGGLDQRRQQVATGQQVGRGREWKMRAHPVPSPNSRS